LPSPASSSPHLFEKIAIPVGVVTTITIGGVTYYLYKKRKAKQANDQNDDIQLFRLDNNSHLTMETENNSQSFSALELLGEEELKVKPTLQHIIGKGGYGEVYYGK